MSTSCLLLLLLFCIGVSGQLQDISKSNNMEAKRIAIQFLNEMAMALYTTGINDLEVVAGFFDLNFSYDSCGEKLQKNQFVKQLRQKRFGTEYEIRVDKAEFIDISTVKFTMKHSLLGTKEQEEFVVDAFDKRGILVKGKKIVC